jgi:hypothetical protein
MKPKLYAGCCPSLETHHSLYNCCQDAFRFGDLLPLVIGGTIVKPSKRLFITNEQKYTLFEEAIVDVRTKAKKKNLSLSTRS